MPKAENIGALASHLRALVEALPEDPWRYFKKVPGAELVPVAQLKTTRARESGIKNAALHMANAYAGKGDKRKPISVRKNEDGSFTVLDGNSTTNIAQQNGWEKLPVVFETRRRLKDIVSELVVGFFEDVYKVGTIRRWKSGVVIKTKSGEWVPYGPHTPVPVHIKPVDVPKALATKNLPKDKTPEQHLEIAKTFLKKHENGLPAALDRVTAAVKGEGAAVMGRVKDVNSAMGKLGRKPKYGTVDNLKDGTGMRVVCESVQDVLDSVKSIKERFKTSAADEEDYINKPKDGYRSYHLIIQDDDGLWKEVQVRTPNQDTWANWAHDIYKPVTPEQEQVLASSKDEVMDYGAKMSEFYYSKDQGKKGQAPDCPEVVKKTFGCLPTS